jgi:hypothetical protein
VEPQVELDEAADLVDVVARVPEALHAVAGHAGADHLVVVEHDLAPRPKERVFGLPMSWNRAASPHDPLGPRVLDHGDRVGEHVLVGVDRVLLEGEGGQLGEELLGQAGAHQEPQPGPGPVDHEQLVELRADALGGDDLEPVVQPADGLDERSSGTSP